MRKAGVGLLAATICIISVIGPAAPAWATSGQACASSKNSGKMCNKILGHGLTVTDVVALFTLPRADYLTRTTWDFELTTYLCDPRGKTKQQCAPDATHRGPSRSGNPPESSCPAAVKPPCSVPVVGSAYAFMRELGVTVPWKLGTNRWLCVEISRLEHGRWVDNAPENPRGDRACNRVHS